MLRILLPASTRVIVRGSAGRKSYTIVQWIWQDLRKCCCFELGRRRPARRRPARIPSGNTPLRALRCVRLRHGVPFAKQQG